MAQGKCTGGAEGEAISGNASSEDPQSDLTTQPQAPGAHDKGEATAEPAVDVAQEPTDPPDENRKAMVESLVLMGNKGWRTERKLQAMHDYFMSRKLYTDFNNFIRRLR